MKSKVTGCGWIVMKRDRVKHEHEHEHERGLFRYSYLLSQLLCARAGQLLIVEGGKVLRDCLRSTYVIAFDLQ